MLFQYKFEGSSEIRTINLPYQFMDSPVFCNHVLNSIFEGTPPCQLYTENKHVFPNQLTVVKRLYGQKFEKEVVKIHKKKRRWRSKSPIKRRWRSKSPKK